MDLSVPKTGIRILKPSPRMATQIPFLDKTNFLLGQTQGSDNSLPGTSDSDQNSSFSKPTGVMVPNSKTNNPTWLPVANDENTKAQNRSRSAKRKYEKAQQFLQKMNQIMGNIHERDRADIIRCQAIVDEYKSKQKLGLKYNPNAVKNVRSQITFDPYDYFANTYKIVNGIVRNELQVTLVDELAQKRLLSLNLWIEIESKLCKLIFAKIMSNKDEIPGYDSSEIVKGFRIIKCDDQFSLNLLKECISKIENFWPNSLIRVIAAKDIPRKLKVRIWLPITENDGERVLRNLKISNPNIAMENWTIFGMEERRQTTSQSFLLLITQDCLDGLRAVNFRVKYGVRKAEVKILEEMVETS